MPQMAPSLWVLLLFIVAVSALVVLMYVFFGAPSSHTPKQQSNITQKTSTWAW